MTLFSRIHWNPALALMLGLGFTSGFGFVPAQADEWNKKTTLTVNNRIQLTDKVLDPGKYVFMLADSSSDRHIVRIYNENQTHLIDTVMAIPNYRLQPTGKSSFTFWETPPGTAPALRAWFYPGDNFGQEFSYPKHPLALEASAATTAPAPPVTRTEPAPPPPQETSPAPEANNEPTPQETQPEIAQNTPPAAAPAPGAAPSQEANREEQPKPKELPKTASPYPGIGLAGGALLALAGLLKLRRLA